LLRQSFKKLVSNVIQALPIYNALCSIALYSKGLLFQTCSIIGLPSAGSIAFLLFFDKALHLYTIEIVQNTLCHCQSPVTRLIE